MAELGLLQVDNLAAMALGAAVLSYNPAGQAFRSPVTLLQDRDGPAGALPGSEVSLGKVLRLRRACG